MKICVLTPRFPFPENGGDVLRINNVCRYLKSKGHILILVSYSSSGQEQNIPENIYDKIYMTKRNRFVSMLNSGLALIFNKPIQIGYYFSLSYLKLFRKVIKAEQPDLYVAHLLRMVPYLNLCKLQNKSIVEMTDVLSKTYKLSTKSSGISIKKVIYAVEKKRIEKYEKRTVAVYKKCVLVSQSDKEFLGNPESVFVYTNGVQCIEEDLV